MNKSVEGAGDTSAAAETRLLIEAGKCKQAVELAKDHYKKSNTPDSQRLLVEAYTARIAQFVDKGMAEEARTLIDLVRQRFPDAIHQLSGVEYPTLAAAGKIDELLGPLGSDQTPAQTRAAIESVVARMVTDLPAVAGSKGLPDGHPVRVAAAAVWKAFNAVTSGPVTDEQIALPEVSRKSPLAAWKMLIRAIALFYRKDDDGCRRSLDAIPSDSAVASVGSAVRAMIDGKKPAGGFAAVLFTRVLVDDKPLRNAIESVDELLDSYDLRLLLNAVSEAMHACQAARPELMERLRQQIYAVAYWQRVPMRSLGPALGTTPMNAAFWKMIARAGDGEPDAETAIFWERFLRHGVAENLFTEDGPKAAAIWSRIGESASSTSLDDLDDDRQRMIRGDFFKEFYAGQPAEIARLRPDNPRDLIRHILEPGKGFERAAKILRTSAVYSRWWMWAAGTRKPDKVLEDIAEQWHKDLPKEVIPLVVMSKFAEDRNALALALRRLTEAEAIDPMNKQVRSARLRLTLAVAWRHFADRKPHLVEKDLADLAALPPMADGDRMALLESMRGAWHAMKNQQTEAAVALQKVTDRMGPVAAPVLFDSIQQLAKVSGLFSLPVPEPVGQPPLEIAVGIARLVRLSSELEVAILIPVKWFAAIEKVVRKDPCPLSLPDLTMIGRGAALRENWPLVYLVTAAGLARADTPALKARFLFLRASSLTQYFHRIRRTQCLRAALELAKQAHDEELTAEVFAAVDEDYFTRDLIDRSADGRGMDPGVLELVLKAEGKAGSYPDTNAKARKFEVSEAVAAGSAADDADFGLDDDNEAFDDGPFGAKNFGPTKNDDAPPNEFVEAVTDAMDRAGIGSIEDVFKDPKLMADLYFEVTGQKIGPSEAEARFRKALEKFGDPSGGLSDSDPFDDDPAGRPGKKKKRRR